MKPYDDPIEITGPDREPVTVAEAALSTRVSGNAEDDLFAIYIPAARRNVERATGRTAYQKTLEWALDYWNGVPAAWVGQSSQPGSGNYVPLMRHIELPRATPLIAIESVKYTDSDGNETTWDPTQYVVDTYSLPGRLVLGFNQTWPSFTPAAANAIKIRYTAGTQYIYPDSIDPDFRTLVLLLVGTLYANRESEIPVDNLAKQLLKLPLFSNMVQSLRVVHEYSDQ